MQEGPLRCTGPGMGTSGILNGGAWGKGNRKGDSSRSKRGGRSTYLNNETDTTNSHQESLHNKKTKVIHKGGESHRVRGAHGCFMNHQKNRRGNFRGEVTRNRGCCCCKGGPVADDTSPWARGNSGNKKERRYGKKNQPAAKYHYFNLKVAQQGEKKLKGIWTTQSSLGWGRDTKEGAPGESQYCRVPSYNLMSSK